MKTGELEKAKRIALQLFDEWNDTTGIFLEHSGYYYEICSVIEDAVDIGAKMASGIKINLQDYRESEILE